MTQARPRRLMAAALSAWAALMVLLAPPSAVARDHQPLHFEPAHDGHAIARVIVVSGDGGWTHIEHALASGLAADHFDIVGINSRAVFTHHQSAVRVAAYIAALSRTKLPTVLLGYSFGADLLPIVWPDLDDATRARIAAVILVAPTHDGSVLIDPSNQYDPAFHPMIPLESQTSRLPISRLICIASEEETESGYSSCGDRALRGTISMVFSGGHDFDEATPAIVNMVSGLISDAIGALEPRIQR
ncbi:MAG: AcvB/VirJ family lysyl-phosphatidylglycerol hydrolase [Labrys sp. (in: a-proteobacteria)]